LGKASLTRRSGMPVLVSSGVPVRSDTVPPAGLESASADANSPDVQAEGKAVQP